MAIDAPFNPTACTTGRAPILNLRPASIQDRDGAPPISFKTDTESKPP